MMMLRLLALAALVACACTSDRKEARGTEPSEETAVPADEQDAPEPAGEADESGAETDGSEGEEEEPAAETEGEKDGEEEEEEGEEKGHDHAGHDHSGPPKNLKVLPKAWSREKLTAFMEDQVNRGLGVECEFCHVEGDYASDEKEHKVEARKMMRMQRATNRTYFGGKPKVTCFTCHQGSEYP